MKKRILSITMLSLILVVFASQLKAQTPKEWGINLDENINTLSKVDDFGFYGAFGFGYTPEGRLWKTTNGGVNWAYQTISGFSPAYPNKLELIKQVHYFDSLNGIHRYNSGSYYKTTDGGDSLTLLSDSVFSNYTFTTLPNTHFANQNVWYKWTRAQRISDSKLMDVIQLTTDGGITWQDISENLYSNYPSGEDWIAEYVQFVSAEVGFVFGQEGFYKTTDGGATWSLVNTLAGRGPIDFIDENTGYVAKHFGLFDEVHKTTDGGVTFTATTLTDQFTLNTVPIYEVYSIDFYDANNGVAACDANGSPFIARTTDGGQTWIQDTIADSILNLSIGFSGFKPIQMVTPDAAFTQIVVNTSKRYIIGFGVAEGSTDTTTNPNPTDAIAKNLESKISIYPNPVFFGNLTIEAEGHYNVNIYNTNGQLIKTELNLNNKSEISLNDINAGLYIIQINGKDYNTTQKLIIK